MGNLDWNANTALFASKRSPSCHIIFDMPKLECVSEQKQVVEDRGEISLHTPMYS